MNIYDIPFADIEEFIENNNLKIPKNEKRAYKIARILMENNKSKGHPNNVILWMMAHNIIEKNIDVAIYKTSELFFLSGQERNLLAKKLEMQGNNIDDIKGILKYLHLLDESQKLFPTRIKEIDLITLQNLSVDELIKIEETTNDKYVKSLLETLWVDRFYKLEFKIYDENFDYKLAVLLLDTDDVSYKENIKYAIDKGLKDIVKLLYDNKVINFTLKNEINYGPRIYISEIVTLAQLPYKKFLDIMIKRDTMRDLLFKQKDIDKSKDFFNKIVFIGEVFKFYIRHKGKIIQADMSLENKSWCLTNGEILYDVGNMFTEKNYIKKCKNTPKCYIFDKEDLYEGLKYDKANMRYLVILKRYRDINI